MSSDKIVHEVLEAQIRAIIETTGMYNLAIALHNACAHGEVFDNIDDEQLEKLYDYLEALIDLSKDL
jgi:predicted RNA polymerase sigma factor